MYDTATESSTLIRIEVVPSQLMTHHPTDGMDEISTIEIFEPVLIRVVGVGSTVEIGHRRVFYPVLITSILQNG